MDSWGLNVNIFSFESHNKNPFQSFCAIPFGHLVHSRPFIWLLSFPLSGVIESLMNLYGIQYLQRSVHDDRIEEQYKI